MAIVAIIPARLNSSRLPRKVLLSETGKPLIAHVVEAARRSSRLDRVIVAADDQEIVDALAPYQVTVVMTDPGHPNGTARLAQAAQVLDLGSDDIIVNIQGDEPELDPDLIDAAVDAFVDSGEPMGTLVSPLGPGDDASDPALVKAVIRRGQDGIHRAVYFSRAPVPHDRDGAGVQRYKHAGIYVYRRAFLERFAALPVSVLERAEQLEQLRAIEAGAGISVAVRAFTHKGIDTPPDYRAFVERMRKKIG